MEKIHINIDTREQKAWAFPPALVVSHKKYLKQGDYALQNDEGFAIERKELNDFVSSITSGYKRLNNEFNRMREANFPALIIIIEADFESICFTKVNDKIIDPKYKSSITPQGILSIIAELSLNGITCLFAKNCHYASALALAIFKKRKEFLENENNSGNNKNITQ